MSPRDPWVVLVQEGTRESFTWAQAGPVVYDRREAEMLALGIMATGRGATVVRRSHFRVLGLPTVFMTEEYRTPEILRSAMAVRKVVREPDGSFTFVYRGNLYTKARWS